MEMHQIRYFLAVCETLNFTRAAEQCNVTQPALTRAVQKLEEQLGGLLFRRERHLSHLTDLGRLMRPQLEQVWKQTEAAKTTARSFLKLEDAPLSLGVMCTIGPMRAESRGSRATARSLLQSYSLQSSRTAAMKDSAHRCPGACTG
jgi:LysR family transcriptional regulator, hydrogen peroxide-inducible genes activator